jgi:mannose-1-phosphate guanylyltransferase
MHLHAVILAGGRGERFWPLSRRDRPKQFLPLGGGRTLLQETADRLEGWVDPGGLWVVASERLMPEIRRQLGGALADGCCVEEPVARNTAAAIGAAAAAIEARDPGAFLLVLPSDHWIPDPAAFRADVEQVVAGAARVGGLHLFGIPVAWPSTGYGYVEEGDPVPEAPGAARVVRFHEKPDSERALLYARDPRMLWNAGIFVWSAAAILSALREHAPSLDEPLTALQRALRGGLPPANPEASAPMARYFQTAPAESIDTLVLERHAEVYVTRARFRWSDVGSWLSWGERIESDAAGNRGRGRMLARDASNCIYYSEGGLLALLGVGDLIVVRQDDVTLVCAKDRAQEVRQLLEDARAQGDLDGYF